MGPDRSKVAGDDEDSDSCRREGDFKLKDILEPSLIAISAFESSWFQRNAAYMTLKPFAYLYFMFIKLWIFSFNNGGV